MRSIAGLSYGEKVLTLHPIPIENRRDKPAGHTHCTPSPAPQHYLNLTWGAFLSAHIVACFHVSSATTSRTLTTVKNKTTLTSWLCRACNLQIFDNLTSHVQNPQATKFDEQTEELMSKRVFIAISLLL